MTNFLIGGGVVLLAVLIGYSMGRQTSEDIMAELRKIYDPMPAQDAPPKVTFLPAEDPDRDRP